MINKLLLNILNRKYKKFSKKIFKNENKNENLINEENNKNIINFNLELLNKIIKEQLENVNKK